MLVFGFILGVLFSLLAGLVGMFLFLQDKVSVKDVLSTTQKAVDKFSPRQRGRIFTDLDLEKISQEKRLAEAAKDPIDRLFPN